MSQRAEILAAVRANHPPPEPLPAPYAPATMAVDLVEQFTDVARRIGVTVITEPWSADQLVAQCFPDARTIASAVPGLERATLPLATVNDPHQLAALDLFVCAAEFGVAENSAVWLTDSRLGHRAAAFLAEHLLVLLDRRQLVADMHAAYARVQIDAEGFGIFVAGPSKTADIEQSLVIGAHGPRSLTILLTGNGS